MAQPERETPLSESGTLSSVMFAAYVSVSRSVLSFASFIPMSSVKTIIYTRRLPLELITLWERKQMGWAVSMQNSTEWGAAARRSRYQKDQR